MPGWNRLSDICLEDLTANSTHWFDQASAAPIDEEVYIQWIGTAVIAGVVVFFTFLLMVSILHVKSVRNKSFNCYIPTNFCRDKLSWHKRSIDRPLVAKGDKMSWQSRYLALKHETVELYQSIRASWQFVTTRKLVGIYCPWCSLTFNSHWVAQ